MEWDGRRHDRHGDERARTAVLEVTTALLRTWATSSCVPSRWPPGPACPGACCAAGGRPAPCWSPRRSSTGAARPRCCRAGTSAPTSAGWCCARPPTSPTPSWPTRCAAWSPTPGRTASRPNGSRPCSRRGGPPTPPSSSPRRPRGPVRTRTSRCCSTWSSGRCSCGKRSARSRTRRPSTVSSSSCSPGGPRLGHRSTDRPIRRHRRARHRRQGVDGQGVDVQGVNGHAADGPDLDGHRIPALRPSVAGWAADQPGGA